MSERGFFSRILGRDTAEDETMAYSAEEIGTRRSRRREPEEGPPQGFTTERAARVIDNLPPDVPRESAVRIVRGTLMAAGIKFEDLERSTRARESKLNSEIDLARNRQDELRKKTEEVVRSLEEEIKKAREARDIGIAEEEENISRALAGLEEVNRVRAFFGFPETEEEETTGPAGDPAGDETQVLRPFDADRTQETRRPGPLTDPDNTTGSSPYGPYDTTDER